MAGSVTVVVDETAALCARDIAMRLNHLPDAKKKEVLADAVALYIENYRLGGFAPTDVMGFDEDQAILDDVLAYANKHGEMAAIKLCDMIVPAWLKSHETRPTVVRDYIRFVSSVHALAKTLDERFDARRRAQVAAAVAAGKPPYANPGPLNDEPDTSFDTLPPIR